jgi:hypothetical protein
MDKQSLNNVTLVKNVGIFNFVHAYDAVLTMAARGCVCRDTKGVFKSEKTAKSPFIGFLCEGVHIETMYL